MTKFRNRSRVVKLHTSRCYGCARPFIPKEGRAAEVLCPRCWEKPEVEMLDVYGLPKVFQGSRMSRQRARESR